MSSATLVCGMWSKNYVDVTCSAVWSCDVYGSDVGSSSVGVAELGCEVHCVETEGSVCDAGAVDCAASLFVCVDTCESSGGVDSAS